MAQIKEGRNFVIFFLLIGFFIFLTGAIDSTSTIAFNGVPVNFNENLLIFGGLAFIAISVGIIIKVEILD